MPALKNRMRQAETIDMDAGSPLDDYADADTIVPARSRPSFTDFPEEEVETLLFAARRLYDRYPFSVDVKVYGPGRFTSGIVANVSRAGVFVAASHPLDVDDRVELVVNLEHGAVAVMGEVRWNRVSRHGDEAPGMGIALEDTTEHRTFLEFVTALEEDDAT